MRVLIFDFDLFTATGGGQTFYRRVIERHPQTRICYLSRGPDLRQRDRLPPNAEPLALDPDAWDPTVPAMLRDAGIRWPDIEQAGTVSAVARALQGENFDVVEVPSFRPCAHLIRPIMAAHGIRVGCVSLGLLGWIGASARMTGMSGADLAAIEAMEAASVAAADVHYTISELHAAENVAHGTPIGLVNMYDALEKFPPPAPEPPGEGAPDLWYVGRLDPAKGPDLFLELAARVPRNLFRRLWMTGPDNTWVPAGQRWSDAVLAVAGRLGLAVSYRGVMDEAALRAEVYRGRSVIVIPSRTDSFNFVALEALANGCPVILSRNAGAAGFLQQHHPAVAPPIVDPEELPEAAKALMQLLVAYPARRAALCAALRNHPWPRPREGFLYPFWRAAPKPPSGATNSNLGNVLRAAAPLAWASAAAWRPMLDTAPAADADLSALIVARGDPGALAATLAAVARQSVPLAEVLVVVDGAERLAEMRAAAAGHGTTVRLLMQGQRGLAAALNRGCAAARTRLVVQLVAGDLPTSSCAAVAASALHDAPGAAACAVPWAWMVAGGIGQIGATVSPDWNGPAVLVVRDRLLAAGGLAATADGAGVVPPSELPLIAAGSDLPLAWRPQDVAAPWRIDVHANNVWRQQTNTTQPQQGAPA